MWHFVTSLQISCKSDPYNQILSQDMQKRRAYVNNTLTSMLKQC